MIHRSQLANLVKSLGVIPETLVQNPSSPIIIYQKINPIDNRIATTRCLGSTIVMACVVTVQLEAGKKRRSKKVKIKLSRKNYFIALNCLFYSTLYYVIPATQLQHTTWQQRILNANKKIGIALAGDSKSQEDRPCIDKVGASTNI